MFDTLSFPKFKFIITLPIFFFLIASSPLIPRPACLTLDLEKKLYTRNEEIRVILNIESENSINVVGATISFPQDRLEVVTIEKDDSILDLWAKEPDFSNEAGIIMLGGGTLKTGGFTGKGEIITIVFRAKNIGKARIQVAEAIALAHDGKGTNIMGPERKNADLHVRKQNLPSPDLNNDNKINMVDASMFYEKIISNDLLFDLNGDGKTNINDMSIILSLMLD